jgi:hypothetical protein
MRKGVRDGARENRGVVKEEKLNTSLHITHVFN